MNYKELAKECIAETVQGVIKTFDYNCYENARGRWTSALQNKAAERSKRTAGIYASAWLEQKKDIINAFGGNLTVDLFDGLEGKGTETANYRFSSKNRGDREAMDPRLFEFLNVVSRVFWNGAAIPQRSFNIDRGVGDTTTFSIMPYFFMKRDGSQDADLRTYPYDHPRFFPQHVAERVYATVDKGMPNFSLREWGGTTGREVLNCVAGVGEWSLIRDNPGIVTGEVYDRAMGINGSLSDSDFAKQHVGVRFNTMLHRLILNTPIDLLAQNKTESGMKFSKFIKMIFAGEELLMTGKNGRTYWEEFDILWSQVIQLYKDPKSAEEVEDNPDVRLSVHPMDYLFMSETRGWGSCHQLHKEHGLGSFAYMIDPVTIIATAPRKIKDDDDGMHEACGVKWRDKTWRQIIHIDLANGSAVFGRQYPGGNASKAKLARAGIGNILASYKGVEPNWTVDLGYGNLKSKKGFAYSESEGHGVMITLDDGGQPVDVQYSVDQLWCPACGRASDLSLWTMRSNGGHIGCPGTLICSCCITGESKAKVLAEEQERTSARHRGGDCSWEYLNTRIMNPGFRPTGEPIIYRYNLYTCDECNSVRRGWNIVYRRDGEPDHQWICRPCMDRVGTFVQCPDCGRMFDGENMDNGWLDDEHHCSECWFNNHQGTCERCGEEMDNEDNFYVSGIEESWCQSCGDDRAGYCPDCDYYYPNDHGTYLESMEHFVCNGCLDDRYFVCDHCDHYEREDYETIYITSTGIDDNEVSSICRGCRAEEINNDAVIRCERCGSFHDKAAIEEAWIDEVCYAGRVCCNSCASYINDYIERRREQIETSNECGETQEISEAV